LGSVVLSVGFVSHFLHGLGRDHSHLDLLVSRSRDLLSDREKNTVTASVSHDDLLLGNERRPLVDNSRLLVMLMSGLVLDLHSGIHSQRSSESFTRRDCLHLSLGHECSIQIYTGLSHEKRKRRGVDGGSSEEGRGGLRWHRFMHELRLQSDNADRDFVIGAVRRDGAGLRDDEFSSESLRVHCS
ncbi:hypothetical protein PMAYCL1PPCAC_19244, partial [Pristionchus mayeri]